MENCCQTARQRQTARDAAELKDLNCRLNRIIGQLNGIQKMLNENRYCGDILVQVAAAESALQSVGYLLLKTHMETCMVDDIKDGKVESVEEVLSLMKKLKV
ncbi:MAG: metal-sensing transcriptional repressor [Erysipelotrichaceae bacterium]|nr:metal-sensing transcriptional repressor [Erysipelotrichaceae bacterium]